MCISYIDLNDARFSFARAVRPGMTSWVGAARPQRQQQAWEKIEGNRRYVVVIILVYPVFMKILTTAKSLQCLKGLETKLSMI